MPSRFNRNGGRRIFPTLSDDDGEQISAGIAIVMLVLLGGLIIYATNDPVRTADNLMNLSATSQPAAAANR